MLKDLYDLLAQNFTNCCFAIKSNNDNSDMISVLFMPGNIYSPVSILYKYVK